MQKIITWNVNSVGVRCERLLAMLQRHAPDIVCLQELKCLETAFPWDAVRAAGYHASVVGQKAYNGVAVLSRVAPDAVEIGFDDGVDDPAARFLSARFGQLSVMSAYVPNGQEVGCDKYFYKLNWLARLQRYLVRRHRAQDQLVLAGDFNIAPADADVHDPAAWRGRLLCSERERAALAELLDFGFFDAFRVASPNETQFTWWDYRMLAFPKNIGLRIDLALITAVLRDRVASCYVDRDERKGDKPSDHAPLVLELRD